MRIRIITLIVVISYGLSNCSKKIYYCGLASSTNFTSHDSEYIVLKFENIDIKNFDSKVLKFKRLGSSNKTIAKIYGKIFENSIYENDTLILPYASIWVKNIKTDSVIATTSNLKGEYELVLPEAVYDLEVQFIGFNNLRIKNLKVLNGQEFNISGFLGEGNGATVYKWNSNETFEKIIK